MENLDFKNKKFDLEKVKDDFCKFFRGSSIEEIDLNNIPKEAMTFFENHSELLISSKDYKPGNFEFFFLIKHSNGDITYLAQQTKNYHEKVGIERLTYFWETRNKENIGHGELRYNISDKDEFFKNKPFVGFSETEKEFQKQGLGKRRLLLMNAYSQMLYQLPLYSSDIITPKAENIWVQLEGEGLAQKLIGENRKRYVMKF